jgi:hypothetical protein
MKITEAITAAMARTIPTAIVTKMGASTVAIAAAAIVVTIRNATMTGVLRVSAMVTSTEVISNETVTGALPVVGGTTVATIWAALMMTATIKVNVAAQA